MALRFTVAAALLGGAFLFRLPQRGLKALAKEELSHDWWTIDLCFWPDAWDATQHCKQTVDTFVAEYT